MSDRELLELAAKAARVGFVQMLYEGHSDATMDYDKVRTVEILDINGNYVDWNPLADDGDALRLAVKLHLDITMYPATQEVGAVQHKHHGVCYGIVNRCFEKTYDDPYAATRRAIVRAAAEIAKQP